MKQKKATLCATLVIGLGLVTAYAQESVNAAGGTASGSGGSVAYSVGQLVYITKTGTNGSVAEGVQQPFEISIVLALKEADGLGLNLTAYPNPTTDFLTLKVGDIRNNELSYTILDMNGKLLSNKKISDNETEIQMNNLVPAVYFLKVIQNDKEVKTFKITKN